MARFSDERFAPIIFQHGERHRRQRAATARFFTPKTVDTSYRAIIERESDALIGDMQRRGHAKLDDMSMRLAVSVAAEVVGVTDSNRTGMARRLERFFRLAMSRSASRSSICHASRGLRSTCLIFTFETCSQRFSRVAVPRAKT